MGATKRAIIFVKIEMKKNLYVVESVEDAKQLSFIAGSFVLCLNPDSRTCEFNESLSIFDTSDFFGAEGHFFVHERSREIIESIVSHFSFCDEFGVSRAYSTKLEYELRFLVNYWLSTVYIISRALRDLGADCVVVMAPSTNHRIEWARRYKCVYAIACAANKAGVWNVEFQKSPETRLRRIVDPLYSIDFGGIGRRFLSVFARKSVRFVLRLGLIRRKVIVCAADSYGMDRAITSEFGSSYSEYLICYLRVQRRSAYARLTELVSGKSFALLGSDDNCSGSNGLQSAIADFVKSVQDLQ